MAHLNIHKHTLQVTNLRPPQISGIQTVSKISLAGPFLVKTDCILKMHYVSQEFFQTKYRNYYTSSVTKC